tara:strand:- start:1449 stop:2552 length:1104 start_codon:yes stop_codon:yes gene_type:complete
MAINRLGIRNAELGASVASRSAEVELFRTIYLTEVVKAFQENNIMSGLTQSRSIANGKSATFPTFWKTNAHYHVPGVTADLDGTNEVRHDEIVITCDRVLMSDIKVAEIDELINHFDVRGMYAEQMGNALAQAYDKQLMGMAYNATQTVYDRLADPSAADNEPAWKGVARQTTSRAFSSGANIVQSIYEALQTLEEYDVPTQGLVCILKPQEYYLLITDGDGTGTIAINRDYGGSGGISSGVVPSVAGIPILKSNNLPTEDFLAGAGIHGHKVNNVPLDETTSGVVNKDSGVPDAAPGGGPKYLGDFATANFKGLILHPTCLGTVKLMDIKYEDEYLIQKQATLMVAKMAVGHGVLREEACIALVGT